MVQENNQGAFALCRYSSPRFQQWQVDSIMEYKHNYSFTLSKPEVDYVQVAPRIRGRRPFNPSEPDSKVTQYTRAPRSVGSETQNDNENPVNDNISKTGF